MLFFLEDFLFLETAFLAVLLRVVFFLAAFLFAGILFADFLAAFLFAFFFAIGFPLACGIWLLIFTLLMIKFFIQHQIKKI